MRTPNLLAAALAIGAATAVAAAGCGEPRRPAPLADAAATPGSPAASGARPGLQAPAVPPSDAPSDAPAAPPGVAPEGASANGAFTRALACVRGEAIDPHCPALRDARRALLNNADADAAAAIRDRAIAALGEPGPGRLLAAALFSDTHATADPRVTAALVPLIAPAHTPAERAAALRALAARDAPEAATAALTLLRDDAAPEVRAAAAYLLASPAHVGAIDKAAPALLQAITEERAPLARAAVFRAVGALRLIGATPGLIAQLDDPEVGPEAALALAAIPTAAAWRATVERLERQIEAGDVPLALLIAITRLEANPNFEPRVAESLLSRALTTIEARGTPSAQSDQVAIAMVKRMLARLRSTPAASRAPSPPPPSPPSEP